MSTIAGAAGVSVAGFVAWPARWRRLVATAFERVPAGTARPAPAVRHGAGLEGSSR